MHNDITGLKQESTYCKEEELNEHGSSNAFPLGSQVRLEELKRNPYPILTLLQEREPVSWIAEVGSWFITRRSDTLAVLLDSSAFSVSSAQSFLEDSFGQTMLSTDGASGYCHYCHICLLVLECHK